MSAVLVKRFVGAHGRLSSVGSGSAAPIGRRARLLLSSMTRNGSVGVFSMTGSGAFHISSVILLTIARSETLSPGVHSRRWFSSQHTMP